MLKEILAISLLAALTFVIAWLATGDAEVSRLITLKVGGGLVALATVLALWSKLTEDW